MSRHFVRSILLALTAPATLAAQQTRDSVRLDDIVVQVSREATSARIRASAADVLDSDELERRQVRRLSDALRLIPAAGLVGTGGLGGTTASFMRGVNSNQTLLLIDGIRVNDANADPSSFLGGFEFSLGDRLEVARGPQSTSFGGGAIGGVIAVAGRVPVEASRLGLEAEAGAFNTFRGRAYGAARTSKLGIIGSITATEADNQRPFNQYDQRTEHVRVEYYASPSLTVGGSLRGLQQSYTSPGDIRTTNTTPVGYSDFDHTLGTIFVDGRPGSVWSTRFTFGGQGYFIRSRSRFNDGPESVTTLKVDRWTADWQHRFAVARELTLIAGAVAEWTDVADNGSRLDEEQKAGYAEVLVTPTDNLTISGGVRHDDYTTFGAKTTGRVAAGLYLPAAQTKLRATYGTGFLPPQLVARFGGAFYRANPDILPEKSKGFDVGVDQFLAAGRAMLSLTYFKNDLTDLLAYEAGGPPDWVGRMVNLNKAETSGLEFGGRATVGQVDVRASYTMLTAENMSDGTVEAERRLIRRPKHAIGFDLAWSPGALTVGAGASGALDREDTDFNAFPSVRVDPGNYLNGRIYAEWRATSGIAVRGRVENVFDKRYEEAFGFPTLGRRATIGISLDRSR